MPEYVNGLKGLQEKKEDLANTPAERARAAAQAQTGEKSNEADDFAAAPEMTVGSSEDGAQHMVIVGAGLVGALCALVLARKGFKVDVFERYEDMRSIPSLGRSINLSVTSRGLRSLKALGGSFYADVLEKLCSKVSGRLIHMPEGDVRFQRYGKDDSECNYSVSRIDLNKHLIEIAEKEGVAFHFNHALSETSDFGSDAAVGCQLNMTVTNADKTQSRMRAMVACPVIACDGAGSRVRYALRRGGHTTFTEELLPTGYKEVLFPNPGENDFGSKGEDGGEACNGRHGLHIWPRGEHMLMALANMDGSFTGTIFLNNKGAEDSCEAFADTEEGNKACREFCEKYYSHAIPYVGGLDELVRQLVKNPTGILGTVFCTNWSVKGKVLLIGDSCHAMVPFFGQGCNCGFEDTLWLSKLLDEHCCTNGQADLEKCTGENFAACFAAVQAERKPNAEAICNMALENHREMSEKTGDERFQAMKKVENKLENTYPDMIRSRYAMVCYGGEGNVSYANAKKLGDVQWGIIEDLFADESLAKAPESVNLQTAKQLLETRLAPVQKELGIDLSTVRH